MGAVLDGPSRWSVAGYEVFLVLGEDARGLPLPTLVYRREDSGRELKGAPKAVKDHEIYGEIRRERDAAKRGVSEARRAIESALAGGEAVGPDALRRFVSDRGGPYGVGRVLLSRVLLADSAGRIGLPALGIEDPPAEDLRIEDLGGGRAPAAFPVRVAHPHDLYAAGAEVLSGWQREVVRRRLRQPVKQAFRELYVVTPAEVEAGTVSARFAGHAVHSQMAVSLLTSRGWEISADGRSLWRQDLDRGVESVFGFETRGHFFGGYARTAGISFRQTAAAASEAGPIRRTQDGSGLAGEDIPLEDVPQPLFSETMRDADLVVSVAQLEAEGGQQGLAWLSREGYARRAELLSAFVGALGLENVAVEGHFARVVGTRASYRVHLGSAAIHVEPGNYLCVVPASEAGAEKDERVFLPFAGETQGDRKAREVVSKVLLLANDAKIEDPTILAQLRRTA